MSDKPMTTDEHDRQLAARGWPGVRQLSEKWGVSRRVVRAISRERLPYLSFGLSDVRRYDPADVETYEQSAKRGVAA